MKLKLLALLLEVFTIASLLSSCETNKHILVTVIDSATNQPIDSVNVKVNAGKNGDYNKSYSEGFTDENGKFETSLMIGCSFGCYDIYIEYSKAGYKNKKDFNITEGSVFITPK